MKTFSLTKNSFLPRKSLLKGLCVLFALLFSLLFGGCKRSLDYFDYVSELRSNIFLAETDGFALRIYAVTKETPYVADGIPQETSSRVEAYLIAPEGDETCNFTFTIGERSYGGEMSFDNVKSQYYFSCTLDISDETKLPCRVEYGKQTLELSAVPVRTQDTLSPQNILKNLETEEAELFASMTDKYGFSGEIYLRLIYEDAPYYYVGIIDRSGNVNAFLFNAKTGKLLAKRSS